MNLKIEYLNVDEIRPYENNPRKHDMEQIKKIADSITEFNFTNPVLIDENNVLITCRQKIENRKCTVCQNYISDRKSEKGLQNC